MITITPKGYGHWKVEITYYRKKIGTTVSDSQLIDDIRDGGKSAIKKARQIIIEQNKTWKSC